MSYRGSGYTRNCKVPETEPCATQQARDADEEVNLQATEPLQHRTQYTHPVCQAIKLK